MTRVDISVLCYFGVILGVDFTYGVPPDYCFEPFNKSDCNMKPTPVFSYYQPGSRCEIEIWRGCPNNNMFDDEYECSHHCIMRLGIADSDDEINVETDDCDEVLNTDNCGKEATDVYTFNKKENVCLQAVWKGCKTKNKFEDEKSCRKKCLPLIEWEHELVNLTKDEAKVLNQILDDVNEIEELKLEETTVATTDGATTDGATTDEATTYESTTYETTTAEEEDYPQADIPVFAAP